MPQILGEKISKLEILWIITLASLVAFVVVFGINCWPSPPAPSPAQGEDKTSYRVKQPDGTILYYIEEK